MKNIYFIRYFDLLNKNRKTRINVLLDIYLNISILIQWKFIKKNKLLKNFNHLTNLKKND